MRVVSRLLEQREINQERGACIVPLLSSGFKLLLEGNKVKQGPHSIRSFKSPAKVRPIGEWQRSTGEASENEHLSVGITKKINMDKA